MFDPIFFHGWFSPAGLKRRGTQPLERLSFNTPICVLEALLEQTGEPLQPGGGPRSSSQAPSKPEGGQLPMISVCTRRRSMR